MSTFPRSLIVLGLDSTKIRQEAVNARILSWVLPLLATTVYLGFPTKNYYWDGISFASTIEKAEHLESSLIHPHHPLYSVVGFFLYRAALLVSADIRAVHVLQIANSLLSACCLWVFFKVVRDLFQSIYLSSLLTLAFAFSSTWWKYSTDADSYVPSVLFLLIATHYLFSASKIQPVPIALAHVLAMLFHQLGLFFYPVVVTKIFLERSLSMRARLRLILIYSVTASTLTIAVNYYCFHLQTGLFGLSDFARWLTTYLNEGNAYSFSFDLIKAIGLTLTGQVRLFFQGRFNWILGNLSLPILLLLSLLTFTILLLLKRIVEIRSLRFKFQFTKLFDAIDKPKFGALLVWILSYVGFLLFWYPYFTPYRIYYLPPLLILFGAIVKSKADEPRRLPTLGLLVMAMALSNFLFFIFPLSQEENYPPLSFAMQLRDSLVPGTVVFYNKSTADNQLVRYFNPTSDWRKFDASRLSDLESQLSAQNGNAVWIDTSGIDQLASSTAGAEWLARHTRTDCTHALINQKFRIELVQLFSKD